MKIKGVGTPPTLSKTGTIDLSNLTPVADGVNFDLNPTTSSFDDTAEVLESATNRVVKAVTLPPHHWTIGIYPADVYDAQTGLNHPARLWKPREPHKFISWAKPIGRLYSPHL